MKDLRYAFRMLLKNPGFTSVAVLSLGLGIGANTTVFCWIENVVLRPLPGVERAEEMVVLTTTHGAAVWDTVSLPDLKDYGGLTNIFAGVIGSQVTPACLTIDGSPEWIYGQIATANYFDLLGVRPILGRTFLPEEDTKPGGNAVLVLSAGFWQRRFGGGAGVIGRTVDLNRTTFTVVGVAGPEFRGTMSGLNCDFWAPLSMHEEVANFGSLTHRGDRWLHTQARLRRGVSWAGAQPAVDLLAGQLRLAYPDTNKEIGFRVLPFWKAPYGGQAILVPVLQLLLAVSVGVLLIVAANVANLLLARATRREKEIAIRIAMGAGRGRLIRQLLAESLLLAACGGVVGVLLAHWGTALLESVMPNTYLPIGYRFELDGATLFFTMGVTLATGFIFGLAPALQASRSDLNSALKEGGRTSGAALPNHRLRSVFVAAQVALALLLLVGAGLCIKGFERAKRMDIGFDPRQVLLAGLRVGMHGYDEERAKVFYRELRRRLSEAPGVSAVAMASYFPLGFEGGGSLKVDVPGYDRRPNEDISIPYSIVSANYFETLRIPLLDGRDFSERDDDKSGKVAIINETMAKRFWPGQNPLGRTFRIWRGELTVVGIVKSGKYRSLNEPARSFFYLPYQQGVWDLNLGVALRTVGPPAAMGNVLRREIHGIDPGVEVWAALAMTDYIEAAFLAQRITSRFLTLLGVLALVLAAMGIYGVMAYVVNQRTTEIGVRMALGAQAAHVLKVVVGQGLKLGLVGGGIGLIGALGLTRLLSSFLYGVSPFDLPTFIKVAALLGGVLLAACYIPARRASRIDPIVALRYE